MLACRFDLERELLLNEKCGVESGIYTLAPREYGSFVWRGSFAPSGEPAGLVLSAVETSESSNCLIDDRPTWVY